MGAADGRGFSQSGEAGLGGASGQGEAGADEASPQRAAGFGDGSWQGAAGPGGPSRQRLAEADEGGRVKVAGLGGASRQGAGEADEAFQSGSTGVGGASRPGAVDVGEASRPGVADAGGASRQEPTGPGGASQPGSTGPGEAPPTSPARLVGASRQRAVRLGPALLGVGVALPGPLDHARGVLHRVTGFPEWDGFPLRQALAERLGVPVVVDKDTNAAALGLAAGGEAGSFAYLHLGTGLGAGLVIGGSLHRGARTGAGEFGHQVIQLDGPPCTCGNRGCVEALCLGAVARGDLREAARVLGAGAANLVGLLDIDVVLLGGRTVAAAPEAFTDGVGAVLEAWARRTGQDAVPVRVAAGGGGVVAAGAAELVLGPVFGRGGV
ncbi:ROK family protein [Streptomyces paradoxus]|uniref:ROK family protein n=1 Tax=Streptomyces paradoxus TaxID=66375 RepID=UPI0037D2ECFE